MARPLCTTVKLSTTKQAATRELFFFLQDVYSCTHVPGAVASSGWHAFPGAIISTYMGPPISVTRGFVSWRLTFAAPSSIFPGHAVTCLWVGATCAQGSTVCVLLRIGARNVALSNPLAEREWHLLHRHQFHVEKVCMTQIG